MRPHPPHPSVSLVIVFVALAAGCGTNEYAPPPPPEVTAEQPVVQDITRYSEYTGTTRAVEAVEIRARVKGFLQSMHFEPGDFVEAGALLFVIDPEPFEVSLEAAQADVDSARAELDLAQTELDRTQIMFDKGAVSELTLIQLRADRDKAKAAVAAGKAAVHSVRLDLDYAHVKAPIDGRVGRRLADPGNLVGASEATLLTTMIRYSPMHVYFHMSERDILALQKLSRHRREVEGRDFGDSSWVPVHVGLAGEEGYPHEAVIDYSALQVDSDTGTFEIRAVLSNEGELDEIILPGTFVRVRLPIGEKKGALLVTERALGADQTSRYLLVIDDKDMVEHRRVSVGPMVDGRRVIEEGLEAGDWVIVKGLQRARPGSKVAPERVPASASAAGETASSNSGAERDGV